MTSPTSEHAIRVLVVDDQADVRFLVSTILSGAGSDLLVAGEAAGGAEAVAQLSELDPDVVILDAMMPGQSGVEVASEILRLRPGQPIVLCSASVDPRVWREATEAGVAACVSKEDFFSLPDVVRGLATRG